MKKILLLASIFTLANAQAFDFRLGPKVGLGLGTITGLKGSDSKVAVGFPIGLLTQFDFGAVAIDAGVNYRYNAFVSEEKIDNDSDGKKDTNTSTLGFSSVEIPVTAYYKLNVGPGFFKFGGGAGLDLGFGKIKGSYEEDNSASADVDESRTFTFGDLGFKQVDVYAIAHLGYEFLFPAWALSIDLQPKYGLINRLKSGSTNADNEKWHTLWFDLSVGFLF